MPKSLHVETSGREHYWLRSQEGSDSDEEHHALAAVQAPPKRARRTWNKVSARAFVAVELAPDDSEALHSKLDIQAYDFPGL